MAGHMRGRKAQPGEKKRGAKKNAIQVSLTPERRRAFLDALAQTGVWAYACRVASPHSQDSTNNPPCSSTFKQLRNRDVEFAAACEEAYETARANVLLEIQRRGQEGWDEKVFQKGTQATDADGNPAVIRKYSDNLLLARARQMMPELFSEKHQHTHMIHKASGAHTFVADDIQLLNVEQRRALTDILLTIQRGRSDADGAPALTYQPADTIEDADFEEADFAEFDLGPEGN